MRDLFYADAMIQENGKIKSATLARSFVGSKTCVSISYRYDTGKLVQRTILRKKQRVGFFNESRSCIVLIQNRYRGTGMSTDRFGNFGYASTVTNTIRYAILGTQSVPIPDFLFNQI